MDDIVNLYTPADTGVSLRPPPTLPPVRGKDKDTDTGTGTDKGTDTDKDKDPDKDKDRETKRRVRKGDDYSEGEDDSDGDQVQRSRRGGRRGGGSRRGRGVRAYDDDIHVIELAAYVLSGVMLIFLFESFITMGASLRAGSSYY